MFFKVTLSNDRVLCVDAPAGDRTRERFASGRFLEGLQNYMEKKNIGNENKIILGDFNCTMFKMERDGRNKTQTLFCCFNYTLSKLIVINGLDDLWRRENPQYLT